MTALTALLHEDAIMTMPPFDLWLTGHDDISGFMTTLGAACAGSRLVPVAANGLPAFAQYKPDPENGGFTPWAVQVLEISEGRITGFHCFLDTARWFPLFGLPLHLEARARPGRASGASAGSGSRSRIRPPARGRRAAAGPAASTAAEARLVRARRRRTPRTPAPVAVQQRAQRRRTAAAPRPG